MHLKHVALTCRSEDESDVFYGRLLGLTKVRTKLLSPGLTRDIFNLTREVKFIDYKDGDVHFEIFISDRHPGTSHKFEHTCLEVDDIGAFLQKCADLGVNVRRIPRETAWITFISDFSGNCFEIKEK